MKVKSESEVAQSFLTLSDPMVCSLPGSSIHGILQARVLEWVVYIIGYVLIAKDRLDIYVRLVYFWITFYMCLSLSAWDIRSDSTFIVSR